MCAQMLKVFAWYQNINDQNDCNKIIFSDRNSLIFVILYFYHVISRS